MTRTLAYIWEVLVSLVTGYLRGLAYALGARYAVFYVTYGVLVTSASFVGFVWFVAHILCTQLGRDVCGRTGGPEDWDRFLGAIGSVAEVLERWFWGPRR